MNENTRKVFNLMRKHVEKYAPKPGDSIHFTAKLSAGTQNPHFGCWRFEKWVQPNWGILSKGDRHIIAHSSEINYVSSGDVYTEKLIRDGWDKK